MFNRIDRRRDDEARPVIFEGVAAALLFGLGAAGPIAAPPEPGQRPQAQMMVRRRIIIRTVRVRPVARDPLRRIEWREAKGPRCLPARAIAGASLLGQDSVDLMLNNGSRVRARLASTCPALDYYSGFYITPGADGFVCADREVIRSRVGGQCEIDAFRALRPIPAP
jgi:hypothetical protein